MIDYEAAFPRDGAVAGVNSTSSQRVAQVLEEHDDVSMARPPRASRVAAPPPPFWSQLGVAPSGGGLSTVPTTLTDGPRYMGLWKEPPRHTNEDLGRLLQQRDALWQKHLESVRTYEADRGNAMGQAYAQHQAREQLDDARLDTHMARLEARFADRHPTSLGGAVAPYVPSALSHPLVQNLMPYIVLGGVAAVIAALVVRILPPDAWKKFWS